MHATYDAHDEASLLCAVHEGHQDLATLLYVANALHLLQEEKRASEPQRGVARHLDGSVRGGPWEAGGAGPALVPSAPWTAGPSLQGGENAGGQGD